MEPSMSSSRSEFRATTWDLQLASGAGGGRRTERLRADSDAISR